MMKRTLLTICLALLVSLVACERNTEQQADTSGTSVTETPAATDSSSTETTAAETGGANETVVGTEIVETEVAETGGTETGGSDEIMAETGGSETGGDATAVPETLAETGGTETGGTETGGSEVGAVTEAVAETGGAVLAESETGGAALAGTETGGAAVVGTETGGAELEGMETGGAETGGAETGGAVMEGEETGGAETGGARTEGAETGGSETGGTDLERAETGGAETGGVGISVAAIGGAETGGAETGGANERPNPELEAGDAELVTQTSSALTDANAAQAVAAIEGWQARLERIDDPGVNELKDNLDALKIELQDDTPDEAAVKTLLSTLGQETSRLSLAAPPEMGAMLRGLGTVLSAAGEASAAGAMSGETGGAETGGAETGGAKTGGTETGGANGTLSGAAAGTQTETGGSSTEMETGGAAMNLQTGTVEGNDTGGNDTGGGVTLPAGTTRETGGTTAVTSMSQSAETGGAAEPLGTAVDATADAGREAETGGTETGGAGTGGVSGEATRENVVSSQAPEVTEGELLASAQLEDADGNEVGMVNLVSSNAGIIFEFVLTDGATLEPGEHGFHVHETGSCTPDFAAAGAHLNPEGVSHGLLSETGPHAGDLPNLVISENGPPTYVVTSTRLSEADLFDADGSAVIIHADPDDYVTDPGGNSGDRVACGVLERVESQ